MYPKLIDFGEVSLWGLSFHPILHTYGLLLALGFLLALKLAAVRGKNQGVDTHLVLDLGLYILISALLGAKLLLLMVDWRHYQHDPLSLLRSGGVFYGGLVAAVVTALWFFRKHHLAPWHMTDILAPSIAFGHGIGRLGCFSAGCCYGKPTSVAWGITFTDEYAREIVGVPLGIPLHPTQLYEAGAEFAIFAVLLFLTPRKRFDGQIFWTYAALYAVARFAIEFFRGDPRGFLFESTLSTSQLISIAVLAAASVALVLLRRRPLPRQA
ncbi:MAG: prolipoprotein diacylglyceryl transferase [Acidobacteriota bacterium]